MQTVTRLFESFQPKHYNIKLTLEREARHFSGLVSIVGNTLHEANELTLHASGLIISSATIDGKTASINYREDELTLSVSEKLGISEHTVGLGFDGMITDALHGLYPCYFEHDGIKEELLVTQFESHHAREVFPCIDEPEAKATFGLTLTTEGGVTVLGNMPVQSDHGMGNGKRETIFETSPRMSTYLLAFVVGKLQHKEAYTKDGVLVRSFATHNQPAESLDFSLDTAIKVIEKFNEYFGVPYPLPKSDHVALPDFSSGAMENWGLITYREVCLLVDPKNSSIASREYVATVIAHELSHQWFGNLVTMKWWDDLWLNESFATLMEYLVIDQLFPEWNIWMTFATSETLSAQRRDCLPGVQSVRTPVDHPDQISTLFDSSIVYAKGAKLLHMLYFYIGDTAFQAGLRIYFKKHAYGNTVGNDLWLALGEAAGKDLSGFMHAWLDKPGYPVVTVQQDTTTLRLSQHRFLSIKPETADTSLWPIPLAMRALPDSIFDTPEQIVTLASPNWVKLNSADQSFFISRYTNPAHRAALREQVASKELGILDRLQLLNESLLLARGNEASITEALELLAAYTEEISDPIWDIIGTVISDARMLLETDLETTDLLKTFVRKLVMPMYDKLGWDKKDDESDETTKLRVDVLGLAVWSEHEPALKEALKRFESFKSPSDIPAELRVLTYRAGARWLGEAAFDKLISLHATSNSSEERNNLAAGITSTTNPIVINKILTLLTDGTKIRLQDIDRWHIYLMHSHFAKDAAWKWLTSHWDFIEANFGSDKSYDNFIRYSAGSIQGKNWLESFDTFFKNKLDQPAITRVIEIGHSDIVARTAWVERDQPILRQYLATTS